MYNFITGNSDNIGNFLNNGSFWTGSDEFGYKSSYASCNGFTNTTGDGMTGNLGEEKYLSTTNRGCWNETGSKFLCFCSEN